jgi:peptide/nickel transport system permease protein
MGLMASLMAAQTGTLLTAAVVVEPVLGRPGLGAVLVDAINTRQGPTLLAVVGVSFGVVAVMNLIGDALSTILDPRVQSI